MPCCSHLFELHDVRVNEPLVVEDLPLHIFGHLGAAVSGHGAGMAASQARLRLGIRALHVTDMWALPCGHTSWLRSMNLIATCSPVVRSTACEDQLCLS